MEHITKIEPQPIADQLMAMCSCGWRKPVSLLEFSGSGAFDEAHALCYRHYISSRLGILDDQ
jgi:hypothetical protein